MAKSSRSVFPKVLITIVVILLVLLLIAEFGLRWFIGRELKNEFADQVAAQGITMEEEPTISFGSSPLLLGLAQRSINHVAVETPDTIKITHPGGDGAAPEISGTPQATVILTDLNISDLNAPVAEHLDLTTFASDEFILATVQAEMAKATQSQGDGLAARLMQELVKITGIRSNTETQAIEVEFTDGAARANLRPMVLNGQLAFEVLDSQLLGFDLPEEISKALTDGIQSQVNEVAGGLQISSIEVVEGGLDINLSGENINVRTLESVG